MGAGDKIKQRIEGFTRVERPKTPPGVPPTEIVGVEGILTPPPFEIPEEERQPELGYHRLDFHTGRRIPMIGPLDAPGMLERFREYLGMGIARRETGPLELEAATRRLAGEEGAAAFNIREEVFGTGKEEEFNRVFARGISGFTGGMSDLLKGYRKDPETFPGALAGAGAHLAGFILGPFRLAKGLTGTRLAPTSSGLKGMAQIMGAGGANLGLATALSSVAPALTESDTLTEAANDMMTSTATATLIGALYPASGGIENKVIRVAVVLAVVDKIRAGFSQWFTIDDVVRGVMDGTIDKRELAEASFGYMMDIYFALHVPSMRGQLAALDNAFVSRISTLDPAQVEATILEMSRRGDIVISPEEGITRREIIRSYGSVENFEKAANRMREPPTTQALLHSAAEAEARGVAETLEQVMGAEALAKQEAPQTLIQVVKEQGGIQPSRAFSKEVQKEIQRRTPGIVRKKAPMQMDQMAEFLRRERPEFQIETAAELEETLRGRLPTPPSAEPGVEALFPDLEGITATNAQIVQAIRKDKTAKLYVEILERLKRGISNEDIAFLAREADQPGDVGFKAFEEALDTMAAEEGIQRPTRVDAPLRVREVADLADIEAVSGQKGALAFLDHAKGEIVIPTKKLARSVGKTQKELLEHEFGHEGAAAFIEENPDAAEEDTESVNG